jgi:hypothetical protein
MSAVMSLKVARRRQMAQFSANLTGAVCRNRSILVEARVLRVPARRGEGTTPAFH